MLIAVSGSAYWPWWLGGLALASVTIGFLLLLRRKFGVSSGYTRLVSTLENPEDEQASQAMAAMDPAVLEALLLAATAEATGRTVEELEAEDRARTDADALVVAPEVPQHVPTTAYAMMFGGIVIGACIAVVSHGGFVLRGDLGPDYAALFGTSWLSYLPLVIGGICVGAGTRMGGGCTSGHGLTGCSRFQVPSLVNTTLFFGTGVVVSLVLDWVVGA